MQAVGLSNIECLRCSRAVNASAGTGSIPSCRRLRAETETLRTSRSSAGRPKASATAASGLIFLESVHENRVHADGGRCAGRCIDKRPAFARAAGQAAAALRDRVQPRFRRCGRELHDRGAEHAGASPGASQDQGQSGRPCNGGRRRRRRDPPIRVDADQAAARRPGPDAAAFKRTVPGTGSSASRPSGPGRPNPAGAGWIVEIQRSEDHHGRGAAGGSGTFCEPSIRRVPK